MKKAFRSPSLWILLTVCSVLAACGGGGSAGGGADGGDSGSGSGGSTATALERALATGNSKDVSLADVAQSTQTLLSAQTSAYSSIKQKLFGLKANGTPGPNAITGIDWNPTHDSSFFDVLDAARNMVVLPSNWSYGDNATGSGVTLAVVGTAPTSGTRYAAFGGNPLGVPGNAAMDSFMANVVSWLTPRSATPSTFKIVTAHLPGTETYWFPHENAVRNWFASHYSGVTINGLLPTDPAQKDNICDGSALNTCLQNADLLVIGREQGPNAYDGAAVMSAVTAAQARGIPVLYLHHYRDVDDLASRLLNYFGLGQGNNYWTTDGLKSFDPSTLPAVPTQLAGYADLITRLSDGTFTTTWSGCSGGRVDCSGDTTYMAQLGTLGEQIRSNLRALDQAGIAIFGQPGYDLEKRLALLGDKYRESVAYPLDKAANEQAFHRALFTDMTAYTHRPYSAVAQNLGNFSNLLPSNTPTASKTFNVDLPSKGSKDYLTGLYVMPGSTVTLTRSDSSGSTVTFGLNKLRNTTWAFNTNGLDRPTQISSPSMPLPAGQSVSITSPYGGPLFMTISSDSGSVQKITVKVDGATAHPLLRDATDPAQVSAFQTAVANTPTNWVAMSTDMLTVFSTLDHFQETMSTYSNNMAQLASDIWTYQIKDTYELAGFNDANGKLQLASRVTAFCNAHAGWDCTGLQHRRDVMQYVISDVHAACGNGCSGNPYDQDWAFGPLGWGESHEVGHNIQPGRLEIYGGISGEVSNNIFPMHKHMHYNIANSGQPAPGYSAAFADRAGAVKSVFDTLKLAQGQSNPGTAAYNAIWQDPSYAANNSSRVAFYRQLAEYSRYYNSGAGNQFSDGWELFTLLYLLDRNFGKTSSANWSSVASQYGFSTYSSYPGSISGNDFMLIATSYIIGRDMRSVFDLWGVTYTSAASSQVAAYGYASAGKLLFPMASLAATPSGVAAPVTVTSSATYPAGY